MRVRLLCAVGVSLWSVTTMAWQAAPPAALPTELRPHVQNGRFDVVTSIRGLPLGVRGELQNLFGTQTLEIAEPGAPFRGATKNSDGNLPMRRLVSAACTYEDCLVYYQRGAGTWRVLLLHWTPSATRFEWGGTAPGTFKAIEDVRAAVLAGTIKASTGPW